MRKGFLLVEFLIYCSITAALVTLVCWYSMNLYHSCSVSFKHAALHMTHYSALDMLVRDARYAQTMMHDQDNEYRFAERSKKRITEWKINKNKMLVRTQGVYNDISRRWSEKKRCVVAHNIEHLHITRVGNETRIVLQPSTGRALEQKVVCA